MNMTYSKHDNASGSDIILLNNHFWLLIYDFMFQNWFLTRNGSLFHIDYVISPLTPWTLNKHCFIEQKHLPIWSTNN